MPKNNHSPYKSNNKSALKIGNSADGLSELQRKFKAKLEGGRFRYINEKLYTCKGEEAFKEFQKDPVLFDVYHEGYRKQVESWPINPLDIIINWIKRSYPNAVIADMGCGEARLAKSVKNTVHSFDLVGSVIPATSTSPERRVIACDIAHVPLESNSVDVVVFCLSLMGENMIDYVREAARILKPNGILKIAEVRSRFFDNSEASGASRNKPDGIDEFKRAISKLGFSIQSNETGQNKMFFFVEARKLIQSVPTALEGSVKRPGKQPNNEAEFKAKPCIYKRR